MSRGHSSKVGVTAGIGRVARKVLDSGVLSKICEFCHYHNDPDNNSQQYRQWQAKHAPECINTHAGSAGTMEAKKASILFGRSVQHYSLR